MSMNLERRVHLRYPWPEPALEIGLASTLLFSVTQRGPAKRPIVLEAISPLAVAGFQIPTLAGEKSMKRLRRINAVFCALSFALVAILNSAVAGQGTQALGINTEGDIVGNY